MLVDDLQLNLLITNIAGYITHGSNVGSRDGA